ncbi:type I-D CRISPR-associated helicase Cas3' [Haloarchaeobius amylolyticus]|uniref:type I-D CRISPR-associated helicase Cas3' n=1 Tax=Haloarchaeobius amylolyticus TaxID=1198296 RepID=UPI002270AB80|nr:type I-D CRISPR-associated helicase Cas3' [Haloarchaeobius amylolyticus]
MQVGEAFLQTEPPKYGLKEQGFEEARAFQNRVVEWVHHGDAPVAAVRAPTGAGKTVTFHELIETRDITLLVYPTNALLRQQHDRFDAAGIDVAILNGNTLEGRAHDRTANLLQFVDRYEADHDVIVTNPDILQAIIQDMYSGSDAMDFFNRFDAIVYDEFHFYGPLAASGLLLQIKIISERLPDPKILLASATPNQTFIDFIDNRIGIDVEKIAAEYAMTGDQFRYPVTVERHEARRILTDDDTKHAVANQLEQAISKAATLSEPQVVLVFNSVRDSNQFHTFLADEYPNIFEHTAKDNGFDTNDDVSALADKSFFILNTTSKGEVGLDYDIRTLFMEKPREANAFLQRFGRAGRQAPATVHVYGLGQGPWGEDVSFQTFEQQIYEGLDDSEMYLDQLADLVGFRAAYAIAVRDESATWYNQELHADFAENIEHFGRWRRLIDEADTAIDNLGGFAPTYTQNSDAAKILKFTRECFKMFCGLRGRSLPAEIRYPRGDRLGLTTYDLTSTLRNYAIAEVDDEGCLVLESRDDTQSVVTARLPEFETEPTRYDQPTTEIEDLLQTKVHREIDRLELDDTFPLDTNLLHRFFRIIRITDAVVPERITTANYDITVTTHSNAPPELEIEERSQ